MHLVLFMHILFHRKITFDTALIMMIQISVFAILLQVVLAENATYITGDCSQKQYTPSSFYLSALSPF